MFSHRGKCLSFHPHLKFFPGNLIKIDDVGFIISYLNKSIENALNFYLDIKKIFKILQYMSL